MTNSNGYPKEYTVYNYGELELWQNGAKIANFTMPLHAKPACAACKFNGGNQSNSEALKCLRYPPVIVGRKENNWPIVMPTDWCGEFVAGEK